MSIIELSDVQEAKKRIEKFVHKTPLLHSRTLSEFSGFDLYLKLENFQRTGSFKPRGALNNVMSLPKKPKGIITASAGNHGQALAYAGKIENIPATIVVPEGAARSKVDAMRGMGATVVEHGKVWDDAYLKCVEIAEDQGLMLIHPFNDPKTIAGQGTVALEILEKVPDTDAIIAGIGGGGLLSGIAFTTKTLKPQIKVFGVEAEGGPAMLKSLEAGHPIDLKNVNTLADGLASRTVGSNTLEITKEFVDEVVMVSDPEMVEAIWLLLERCKILAEMAGASSVAAALNQKIPLETGSKVVCVVSGGNIDLSQLSKFIQHKQT
jgi:threonine dehydratase